MLSANERPRRVPTARRCVIALAFATFASGLVAIAVVDSQLRHRDHTPPRDFQATAIIVLLGLAAGYGIARGRDRPFAAQTVFGGLLRAVGWAAPVWLVLTILVLNTSNTASPYSDAFLAWTLVGALPPVFVGAAAFGLYLTRPDIAGVSSGSRARLGTREVATVLLLLLGGFLFLIGWLAGLIMLWRSDRWNLRDRLLGTFIVPGGLATLVDLDVLGAGSATTCVPTPAGQPESVVDCVTAGRPSLLDILLAVMLYAAPILVGVHLLRGASRPCAVSSNDSIKG